MALRRDVLSPRLSWRGVDLLSDVLRSLRLSGSLLVRCHVGSTWGYELAPFEMPVFHAILAGHAWLEMRGWRSLRLATGDVVIARRCANRPSSRARPS